MILVDAATGSNELADPLRRAGLPVDVTHLEFGDVAFGGRGEGGSPLYIGIELKKIGEFVGSLRSHRFQGHQLLGLCKDFDRRYLILEGDFHHDSQGRAVTFRQRRPRPLHGAASAMALEQEILNIQTRGGVWVRHTTGRRDTLRVIEATYRYWTDKDLDQHKSHLALYAPDFDKGLLTPTSDFRKIVALVLPGCGLAVSKAIEEACRASLTRLLGMSERHLASIVLASGRKLGAAKATQIKAALEGLR